MITPEQWRKIDDLFDAAIGIEPDRRPEWLQAACENEEVRSEVALLLESDAMATLDGFLTPAVLPARDTGETGDWSRSNADDVLRPATPAKGLTPHDLPSVLGFVPKAAIAFGPETQGSSDTRGVVRARLRELPFVYILIYGIYSGWRYFVIGNPDPVILALCAGLIAVLATIAAVLWSPRRFTLAGLKAIELGMFVMLAGMVGYTEYRSLLRFSRAEDPISGQMVIKNAVSLSSILILTWGIYVPKSWRRASTLAVPLALLPFAIMLTLYLQHPEELHWLHGWRPGRTTPLALFSMDAMLLACLAVGSSFGAFTISKLHREVAEARQIGQYRLQKLIGAGGMGEVYLAEHQLLKRPCALKLILPRSGADPRILERFEREVRITSTLSHPNTVEIYDYGRTEDGTYYYVMEYLPGLSLADLIDRYGPLPPGRVVYLIRQVCLALREAHDAGLIHRDVKPSNIFAARRGGMDDVAKLLDFGLVRPVANLPQSSQTIEGQILGTPLFMSPEQAMGGARSLDRRSDLYSLGVVAYAMLTGRPPFEQAGGIAVMIAHARDPVVPPSRLVADIEPDLEAVVLRCLAKDPSERYQDAESLERALASCDCVGDWNEHLARRWWREITPVPASLSFDNPTRLSGSVGA